MSLREITQWPTPPNALREQPAPMLDWLKIDNLRIDDRYQRPLGARNWAAISKIAANFDWCAFGPILCAPVEGGLYAVIDGQHRVHAAVMCGIEKVPAMIVPVPPAKQALAFVKVNSGISVTAHQSLRAELAAQDPEAAAMAEACRAGGCELMGYKPSASWRKPRQIFNISFVRKCIQRGESEHLTTALAGLVAYDATGRTGLYTDYILKPLLAAVVETGADAPFVTAALRLRDPFHALEAATKFARDNARSVGTEQRRALARLIEKIQSEGIAA